MRLLVESLVFLRIDNEEIAHFPLQFCARGNCPHQLPLALSQWPKDTNIFFFFLDTNMLILGINPEKRTEVEANLQIIFTTDV